MTVNGAVAFVTGANRGLGAALTKALVEGGAERVYASARNPEFIDLSGFEPGRVVPVKLDITDAQQVAAAAELAEDVTLLVNNAGVSTLQNIIGGDSTKSRQEMDVHFFGLLGMIRTFAPVIAANGGGSITNILSAASWLAIPVATAYSTAKAAAWGLTDAARVELAPQGIVVTGVHVGAIDTDMMAAYDVPKTSPADVAAKVLAGIEAGDFEVLVDAEALAMKSGLALTVEERYPFLR